MNSIFIFLFLAIFPFGQIIRIGVLHPIDIVVAAGAIYVVFAKLPRPPTFKYFNNLLIIALYTYALSVFLFEDVNIAFGLLYLIRLGAYFYFLIYVWNFVKLKKTNRNLLLDCLLGTSVVSAIFGWIQFFWIPDIKPFYTWGWDEHLFRLVGTFLDPTFLGLIMVFGLLTVMMNNLLERRIMVVSEKGNKEVRRKFYVNFIIGIFLLVSLVFSYSRASYLAFVAGAGYLLYAKRRLVYIFYLVPVLVGLVWALPTSKNHSIEIFRSFSALARIENYKTTLEIFGRSPLFGVGYNNMCLAYNKFIGVQSYASHACSGSDSSLLLILATTGVVGFVTFGFYVLRIHSSLVHDSYFLLLNSCVIAILVHSFFSNSLFYPWLMGYLVILLATSSQRKS